MAGEPLIVGSRFAATLIEKDGRDVTTLPSLTVIAIPEKLAALPAGGVPASLPLLVLKLAQDGRLLMPNVNESPSGSLAVGVKLYGTPSRPVVAGLPLITGGRFGAAGAETVIANDGSDALDVPSETLIRMLG